ncbi:MAG: hypothetical protein BM558_03360 [Roseobacter sp. MedPE-SW]|nr:MAG: hypothetical protein BM558_03360 [Roseobacter sp. MedPE-SW]
MQVQRCHNPDLSGHESSVWDALEANNGFRSKPVVDGRPGLGCARLQYAEPSITVLKEPICQLMMPPITISLLTRHWTHIISQPVDDERGASDGKAKDLSRNPWRKPLLLACDVGQLPFMPYDAQIIFPLNDR